MASSTILILGVLRSLVFWCSTIYICKSMFDWLVLDPLGREGEQVLAAEPEEDLGEDKPIFIPFPGTTKELKPKPYRGADPEWQEFVKFSKDRPLQKRVRDDLAQYIRQVAEKTPTVALRVGKGLKIRRCWLDVDFPPHPPPEFERSGIEISDDAISWVTMPVDSLTVFRTRRALWPSPLMVSFWSFGKALAAEEIRRVVGMLGYQPQRTQSASIDQLLSRQRQITKPISKDGPAEPAGGTPTSALKLPSPVPVNSTGKAPEDADDFSEKARRMEEALAQRFVRPLVAFKTKLGQTWRRVPNYPPRGSILISGMVEMESPKAYLVFDVKAAWDPKTKSYDTTSMHLGLRRFQWKAQGPLAS
ncbi:hypothetical protein BJ875DRAFT_381899 [Amylocarpus encephaloides]|uniref:Uncharacterized protein n=1 Tax=Amylocarpus encephaloides TaxID=45428 RepID=A0A9P7YE05_9HELO|nr:hypothetical protein BJ875DRAFT_381899 [Amylocarpus encephaloides]